MTEPTIRSATPADADAVLALWQAADAVPSATDDPENVTAEDHATGFWTHVDYDADGRITRYVKTSR